MNELTEEQRKELEEKLKNMSPEELKEFQKQQCIFCQIISGKVPSKKIYEDDVCIAVLDINPAAKGHLLIMPKEHYAIMPQIPDHQISQMFLVAKHLSQILLKSIGANGTNIFIANGLVAGQRAQHFMLHLIPRKDDDKILDIEEKLIDTETRKKVKLAVEKRLNELLGIKKEVVDVSEKEAVEPAKTRDEQTEIDHDDDGSDNKIVEEVKEKKSKTKGKKPAAKNKSNQKKVKSKEIKGKKEEIKEPEDKEESVSLDEIASLFK